MTIEQVAATRRRLLEQTRDEAPRGKGSKALRRRLSLIEASGRPGPHLRGLSRTGKTQSKAQQRLFFANPALRRFAHDVARRGAAFKTLPERKHPPGGVR